MGLIFIFYSKTGRLQQYNNSLMPTNKCQYFTAFNEDFFCFKFCFMTAKKIIIRKQALVLSEYPSSPWSSFDFRGILVDWSRTRSQQEGESEVGALRWTCLDLHSIAANRWQAAWRRLPTPGTSQPTLRAAAHCHLATPDRSDSSVYEHMKINQIHQLHISSRSSPSSQMF